MTSRLLDSANLSQDLFHASRGYLPREILEDPLSRMPPKFSTLFRVFYQSKDGGCPRGEVVRFEENRGSAFVQQLGDIPLSARDDRTSGGRVLENLKWTEIKYSLQLMGGDRDIDQVQKRPHRLGRLTAEEGHGNSTRHFSLKLLATWTVADQEPMNVGSMGRGEHQLLESCETVKWLKAALKTQNGLALDS